MDKSEFCNIHCPVEATISLIGGKYKVIIIYQLLLHEVLRFNELRRIINKATPKMLTSQLRELENDGIISRKVYPVVPPKTEYRLTELGKSLVPVMNSMRDWGRVYLKSEE